MTKSSWGTGGDQASTWSGGSMLEEIIGVPHWGGRKRRKRKKRGGVKGGLQLTGRGRGGETVVSGSLREKNFPLTAVELHEKERHTLS